MVVAAWIPFLDTNEHNGGMQVPLNLYCNNLSHYMKTFVNESNSKLTNDFNYINVLWNKLIYQYEKKLLWNLITNCYLQWPLSLQEIWWGLTVEQKVDTFYFFMNFCSTAFILWHWWPKLLVDQIWLCHILRERCEIIFSSSSSCFHIAMFLYLHPAFSLCFI